MNLGDYTITILKMHTKMEAYWVRDGFLLRHPRQEGWTNLDVVVTHHPTAMTTTLSVGPSQTGEYIVPYARQQQTLPANVVSSASFEASLLTGQSTLISIPSILELSVPSLRRESISSQERFEQTLQQVRSVRHYCPEAQVILQELSVHVREDWLNQLAQFCDLVILYGEDHDVYPYAHEWSGQNKGLGEMRVTLHLLSSLGGTPIQHFIKFGGRYALQPDFNLETICTPLPTFNGIYTGSLYGFLVYTVMYVLPRSSWKSFTHMLKQISTDRLTSIEKRYTWWLMEQPAFTHVRHFHVEGLCIGTKQTLYL